MITEIKNSSEVRRILQGLRMDAVELVRVANSALEHIDALSLLNEARPTVASASIDDVIEAVLDSGLMKHPSDWAAVLMLAHDMGKKLTYISFINALSNNTKAINFGLPLRQTLYASYIEHSKQNAYPYWSRNTRKEERYYRIAESVYDLVSVL